MNAMRSTGRASPRLGPRIIALVFVGGMIGTAAREGLVLLAPVGALPWGVLAANLTGALLLAFLVRILETPEESPRRRDVRFFAGTGVLGGFTTYSALAADALLLLETAPILGVVYAAGSVLGGVAAAAFGWALASWARRRRPPAESVA